jgi:hypothetical protein
MKRILTLLVAIFAFTTFGIAQSAFTINGGYSWSYGLVGAEYQLGRIGVGAGWMPTSYPGSGDKLNSFSGVVTWYGAEWWESCYYTSLAFASKGYRREVDYGSGWTDNYTTPMGIWILGYKAQYGAVGLYGGGGVGFCSEITVFAWEVGIKVSFGN